MAALKQPISEFSLKTPRLGIAPPFWGVFTQNMVERTGFEPVTPTLRT